MNRRKKALPALVIVLFAVFFVIFLRRTPTTGSDNNGSDPVASYRSGKIVYSKHARCRMDCRKISEEEIKEVLQEGVVNHGKSEPELDSPRYALEDVTQDGQKVRIVIALEKNVAVLVTCIDLEKEWPCNCN